MNKYIYLLYFVGSGTVVKIGCSRGRGKSRIASYGPTAKLLCKVLETDPFMVEAVMKKCFSLAYSIYQGKEYYNATPEEAKRVFNAVLIALRKLEDKGVVYLKLTLPDSNRTDINLKIDHKKRSVKDINKCVENDDSSTLVYYSVISLALIGLASVFR